MDARVAPGLTNQQLGGVTHGISGLIDARSSQLQVLDRDDELHLHGRGLDGR